MIKAILLSHNQVEPDETEISLGEIQSFHTRQDLEAMQMDVNSKEDSYTTELVELNRKGAARLRDLEASNTEGQGIDDIIEEHQFDDNLTASLDDYTD